jgi:hypothetical protein
MDPPSDVVEQPGPKSSFGSIVILDVLGDRDDRFLDNLWASA